jgi:hypothetical protein
MNNRSIKDQLMEYLWLKKKDPNAPNNTNIKLMHGMNKISILVFLFALVVMIIRALNR